MLSLCGTHTHGVFRIFEVLKHREFCTIKKAYKLLTGAVKKNEVGITTIPHLT
jgi:hypothetical protein